MHASLGLFLAVFSTLAGAPAAGAAHTAQPAGDQANASPRIVVVTDNDAVLRCGEGVAYYSVADLRADQPLRVVETTESDWLAVAYPEGTEALALASRVRVIDRETVELTEPTRLLALHATRGERASWAKLLPMSLPAGTLLRRSPSDTDGDADEGSVGKKWVRLLAPAGATGYILAEQTRDATDEEAAAFLGPQAPAEEAAPSDEPQTEPTPQDEPAESEAAPTDDIANAPTTPPTTADEPTAQQPGDQPESEPQAEPEADQGTPAEPTESEPAPATDQDSDPATPAEEPTETATTEPSATDTTPDPRNPFVGTNTPAAEPTKPAGNPFLAPGQTAPPPTPAAQESDESGDEQTAEAAEPAPPLAPRELDAAYRRVRTQPQAGAEYEPLLAEYDRTLGGSDLTSEARETLSMQRRWLELKAALEQQRRANTRASRQAQRTRSQAESDANAAQASRPYDVSGILRRSAVYTGGSLPALYRIISVEQRDLGTTIAYVREPKPGDFAELIGEVIGVTGRTTREAGGLVEVITPQRFGRAPSNNPAAR